MLEVDLYYEKSAKFDTSVYLNSRGVSLSFFTESANFGLHFGSVDQLKCWLASLTDAVKEELFAAGISPFIATASRIESEESEYVTLNNR